MRRSSFVERRSGAGRSASRRHPGRVLSVARVVVHLELPPQLGLTPVGETRVDLLHLLEDLADAYPGDLDETILTEIVANSLDSGASHIGVARDSAYVPETTTARFALGSMSTAFTSVLAQLGGDVARRAGAAIFREFVRHRLLEPIGAQRTSIDSTLEAFSTVDDLYRLELALEDPAKLRPTGASIRPDEAWVADYVHGTRRLALFSTAGTTRGAFVRVPSEGITIILLTDRIDDPQRVTDAVLRRILPHSFVRSMVPK